MHLRVLSLGRDQRPGALHVPIILSVNVVASP